MSTSSVTDELQVQDVHDMAYDIAQEFEKIISSLNSEESVPLINKVIKVLELLESNVQKSEHLETEIFELRSKYVKLLNDKTANEEEKSNLKQAFEELENSWAKESISLRSIITKLEAENKLLHRNITEKEEIAPEIDEEWKTVIENKENFISKLKSNLKQKDDQLVKNSITIEKLNQKIDDLLEVNKSLHTHYQESKTVILANNIERNEYESEIEHQKQKIINLENRNELLLKMSQIEKKEVNYPCEESYISEESYKSILEAHLKLKQEAFRLQMEVDTVKRETEEFKKQLSTIIGSHYLTSKRGHIQKIFRLFLGMVHFEA